MKKVKLIILFSLATFLFTACEKENSQPSNRMEAGESAVKSKPSFTNKSDSSFYYDMLDYAIKIVNDTAPANIDEHLGLLYLEAAVNYERANIMQSSVYSEVIEFSMDVTIVSNGGELEIEGSEALQFYNNLLAEVDSKYSNSDLVSTYGNDAFISVVDLEYDQYPQGSGLEPIDINLVVKYYPEPIFPFCSAENDWRALDLLGMCADGSYDNLDAARRLEDMLTHSSCSSFVPWPHCARSLFVNVVPGEKNGFETANIWDGDSPSDCITYNQLNGYRNGALTEAVNMLPTNLPPEWGNPDVAPLDFVVGKVASSQGVAHNLKVYYGSIWCPPIDVIH